jgi:hypothetical protein
MKNEFSAKGANGARNTLTITTQTPRRSAQGEKKRYIMYTKDMTGQIPKGGFEGNSQVTAYHKYMLLRYWHLIK